MILLKGGDGDYQHAPNDITISLILLRKIKPEWKKVDTEIVFCLILLKKVKLQNFSLVELWTLTGPLEYLDRFLFQLLVFRFAVLPITVLLYDPIWTKL